MQKKILALILSLLFVTNLSFGLSSSDSKNFASQLEPFSGEMRGKSPLKGLNRVEEASKHPEEKKDNPKNSATTSLADNKTKEKNENKQDQEGDRAWFAGTLLPFAATNIAKDSIFIQPYLFASNHYGFYNQNSQLVKNLDVQSYAGLFTVEIGLTDKINVEIELGGSYFHSNFGDRFEMSDTMLFLGFPMLIAKKNSWIPNLRALIGQIFPTGKYDELDPLLQGVDATGSGSFQTWLILAAGKVFRTRKHHPYKININLYWMHSCRTQVKGYSIFGGENGTLGTVTPGEAFNCNFSYEYKFNKHWGWGFDLNYVHQNSSSFHRMNQGISFPDPPSSEILSCAPMIEYNFDENFSLSAGMWFSLTGRNEVAFTQGYFSVYKWY